MTAKQEILSIVRRDSPSSILSLSKATKSSDILAPQLSNLILKQILPIWRRIWATFVFRFRFISLVEHFDAVSLEEISDGETWSDCFGITQHPQTEKFFLIGVDTRSDQWQQQFSRFLNHLIWSIATTEIDCPSKDVQHKPQWGLKAGSWRDDCYWTTARSIVVKYWEEMIGMSWKLSDLDKDEQEEKEENFDSVRTSNLQAITDLCAFRRLGEPLKCLDENEFVWSMCTFNGSLARKTSLSTDKCFSSSLSAMADAAGCQRSSQCRQSCSLGMCAGQRERSPDRLATRR